MIVFAVDVHRAHALARLLSRTCRDPERPLFAFIEAKALLWKGRFARSLAVLDETVIPANPRRLGVLPIVVKLECLLFEERVEAARTLFEAHRKDLEASWQARGDVSAIIGIMHFYSGDLEEAETALQRALRQAPRVDPIRRAAHFWLAAIAHRHAQNQLARTHLRAAIEGGQDLFIVRWAVDQWTTMCSGEPIPHRPVRTRSRRRALLGDLLSNLWIGLHVLCFRTNPLKRLNHHGDQVALLVLVCIGVTIGLHSLDYSRNAVFLSPALVTIVPPLFAVLITAVVAAPKSESAMRIATAVYSALPLLLIVLFAAAQLPGRLVLLVEVPIAIWALAVVIRVARVIGHASTSRLLVCAVVFTGAFLVPVILSLPMPLFYERSDSWEEYEERARERPEEIVAQADQARAAAEELDPDREGVTDLYFLGAAGSVRQDVFLSEIESARRLLDERFDTRGRSMLLANDRGMNGAYPLTATVTLSRAIDAIARRMNPEEDVLFLLLTSHGSKKGLSLSYPPKAPFRRDVLRPAALRSMLDDAGIKWRVVVIAGCRTGVFIEPHQTEFSLVATAAADDRPAYGCADGNPFTDFGRALFGEQLLKEQSFPTAFHAAVQLAKRWDEERERKASQPRVFEGSAIRNKLHSLEARLAAAR